uniref:Mediator of RNA polymerase II transcription subunit 12 n=1 Tax=Schistocephalus solidus TaxID=70667 RepID=A0A0X3PWZ1_SCHSO
MHMNTINELSFFMEVCAPAVGLGIESANLFVTLPRCLRRTPTDSMLSTGKWVKEKKNKDRDKDSVLSSGANPTHFQGTTSQRTSKDTRPLEEIHDELLQRYRCLSYYDMECVISQTTPIFLQSLSGISGSGASVSGDTGDVYGIPDQHTLSLPLTSSPLQMAQNSGLGSLSLPTTSSHEPVYLPVPHTIFLFFDMIEASLNLTCLLDTVVQTLERLQAASPRSQFMSSYMSIVCLRIIGILRTHQPVLMTMSDLQLRVFSCLMYQVRQGKEKAHCKRCIVAYLNDLLKASCIVARENTRYPDPYSRNNVFLRPSEHFESVFVVSRNYIEELLTNTGDSRAAFRACIEDVRTNPQARVNFVYKALAAVSDSRTYEHLNYLFDLFAELMAQCIDFQTTWLEALSTIVAPRAYTDPSITTPDMPVWLENSNIWDNLASLIGTLLAKQCLPTSDFFVQFICQALAQGLDQGSAPVDSQHEPTVRFACHLLHRLFAAEPCSTVHLATSAQPANADTEQTPSIPSYPPFRVSEPLLLTGALQKVTNVIFVDTLKMLMVHSDKGVPDADESETDKRLDDEGDGKTGSVRLSDQEDNSSDNDTRGDSASDDNADYGNSSVDTLEDLDTVDGPTKNRRKRRRVHLASKNKKRRGRGARKNAPSTHTANRRVLPNRIHPVTCNYLTTGTPPTDAEIKSLRLRDFAYLVLREVCVTPWVRETWYRISSLLLQEKVLIDKDFSRSQARHLLHILYQPHDVKWVDTALKNNSLADAMMVLLTNLSIWTLHSTWMEFELLYKQVCSTQEADPLPYVAQSIVENFNEQALEYLKGGSSDAASSGELPDGLPDIEVPKSDNIWLLLSLVAKLPTQLKVSIVKTTWDILRSIKQFLRHKNDEDKERVVLRHSVILAHPAFSALLQVCMQETDSIDYLYEQVDFFLANAKETRDRMPENLRTRHVLQECLSLRLALVGRRLCTEMDAERISRWAVLLAQLIGFGVTEPHSNQTLFFTCLDMLHTLVHNLVAMNGAESKVCVNLNRRIRKELADRHFTAGIEYIKPLLFIGRSGYSFIVVNPLGGGPGGAGPGAGNRGEGGSGTGKLGGSLKSSNLKMGNKSSSAASSSSFSSSGCGGGRGLGSYGLTTGAGLKSFSRKRGYVFSGRERLAPWDVYDPNRRLQLLSTCGAVPTEASLTRVEEQANLLVSHEHPIRMRRSPEFYFHSIFPEPEHEDSVTAATTIASPENKNFLVLGSPSKRPPQQQRSSPEGGVQFNANPSVLAPNRPSAQLPPSSGLPTKTVNRSDMGRVFSNGGNQQQLPPQQPSVQLSASMSTPFVSHSGLMHSWDKVPGIRGTQNVVGLQNAQVPTGHPQQQQSPANGSVTRRKRSRTQLTAAATTANGQSNVALISRGGPLDFKPALSAELGPSVAAGLTQQRSQSGEYSLSMAQPLNAKLTGRPSPPPDAMVFEEPRLPPSSMATFRSLQPPHTAVSMPPPTCTDSGNMMMMMDHFRGNVKLADAYVGMCGGVGNQQVNNFASSASNTATAAMASQQSSSGVKRKRSSVRRSSNSQQQKSSTPPVGSLYAAPDNGLGNLRAGVKSKQQQSLGGNSAYPSKPSMTATTDLYAFDAGGGSVVNTPRPGIWQHSQPPSSIMSQRGTPATVASTLPSVAGVGRGPPSQRPPPQVVGMYGGKQQHKPVDVGGIAMTPQKLMNQQQRPLHYYPVLVEDESPNFQQQQQQQQQQQMMSQDPTGFVSNSQAIPGDYNSFPGVDNASASQDQMSGYISVTVSSTGDDPSGVGCGLPDSMSQQQQPIRRGPLQQQPPNCPLMGMGQNAQHSVRYQQHQQSDQVLYGINSQQLQQQVPDPPPYPTSGRLQEQRQAKICMSQNVPLQTPDGIPPPGMQQQQPHLMHPPNSGVSWNSGYVFQPQRQNMPSVTFPKQHQVQQSLTVSPQQPPPSNLAPQHAQDQIPPSACHTVQYLHYEGYR